MSSRALVRETRRKRGIVMGMPKERTVSVSVTYSAHTRGKLTRDSEEKEWSGGGEGPPASCQRRAGDDGRGQ